MKPERFSSGNCRSAARSCRCPPASMKPERFSSGNHNSLRCASLWGWAASMKPERFSSGNRAVVWRHGRHRNLASMKPERFSSGNRSIGVPDRTVYRWLQWSRSVSAPETVQILAAHAARQGRFNEAGAFQLRKPGPGCKWMPTAVQLQ